MFHGTVGSYYLCVSRFTNETFKENKLAKKKYGINALYGVPFTLSENIQHAGIMFILDLNVEENRIEGVGMVRNSLQNKKVYKIYSNHYYNRYTYYSNLYVPREKFTKSELVMLEQLESILCYGSSHMKRGWGIQRIPQKFIVDYRDEALLLQWVQSLFLGRKSIWNKKIKSLYNSTYDASSKKTVES